MRETLLSKQVVTKWAFAAADQAFGGWPYSFGSEWSLWLVSNIECYKIKKVYNSPLKCLGSLFSCNNPILMSSKDCPRHRRCLVAGTLQEMSQAHLGHLVSWNQTGSTLTIEINEQMCTRLRSTLQLSLTHILKTHILKFKTHILTYTRLTL
jgi:hypothetical protein